MKFDSQYFQPLKLTNEQLEHYHVSATRDLAIAEQSTFPEVTLRFSYDALLKLGIFLLAKHGQKIRSIPGHHIKVLQALSMLLDDEELFLSADEMRKRRNLDMYQAGLAVTEKDATDALLFVKEIFKKSANLQSPYKSVSGLFGGNEPGNNA